MVEFFAHFCAVFKYVVAFCNRPEAVSDVISGAAVELDGVDVHVNIGEDGSNRSGDTGPAHLVMADDERRRTDSVVIGRTPNGVLIKRSTPIAGAGKTSRH